MCPLPPPTPSWPARRQQPQISAAQQATARPSQDPSQPPHSRIAGSLIPSYLIPSNSFVFICFKFIYSKPPPPAGLESCPTCQTLSLRLRVTEIGRQRCPAAFFGHASLLCLPGRLAAKPRGRRPLAVRRRLSAVIELVPEGTPGSSSPGRRSFAGSSVFGLFAAVGRRLSTVFRHPSSVLRRFPP